ncbi:MAG: tRNA (adenosine(37)-N6)-threonylcarbamoyltransferase complex ATPase subunit type 1 TsaE [Lachnospiraceae bacterium]|jgi:tRNA threonylcarbamoyladenosine biosynthesis protein TsaE|nr:tRNA (adenosine(37)-N6)-threonylcarbamoyltransferase complex ATPase subunit type 1 TsaE [Lachnospiraceae bacterium]
MKQTIIDSFSEEDTFRIAKEMGEKAYPGEVISLVGDLGTGKTLFSKGFAEGLGIDEPITSPTFTILQIYETGRLPFYHFDVYRIGSLEELEDMGYYEYVDGKGVSLIEWADLFEESLPKNHIEVKIEKDLEKGFDYRRVSICEF